jgi:alpha-methylacyl-CoA racemase
MMSEPLGGLLVVDLTRHLPGPFASRELMNLGARVVRLEAPGGDPLRRLAPAWHDALNAGKESVVCDLKAEPAFGRALCARADIVLEGFRPGVAERLGISAADLPESVTYCAITGFGSAGANAVRVGHDLNYLGFAGLLAETGQTVPPLPIADLAAGALMAVNQILAALYARTVNGKGRRIEISMTHNAYHLVSYRLGGEHIPGLLAGSFACYRIYETADGRLLTVAALEPKFFQRLCTLVGQADLAGRQFDTEAQEEIAACLAGIFRTRSLAAWLELFAREDVAVGPVNTLAEAAALFGGDERNQTAAELGEHTAAWRAALA